MHIKQEPGESILPLVTETTPIQPSPTTYISSAGLMDVSSHLSVHTDHPVEVSSGEEDPDVGQTIKREIRVCHNNFLKRNAAEVLRFLGPSYDYACEQADERPHRTHHRWALVSKIRLAKNAQRPICP